MTTNDQRPTTNDATEVVRRLEPGRTIEGISAVLLPIGADDKPDLEALGRLIERTYAAGLTPAVNMDTGYVNLLDDRDRAEVLRVAREVSAGRKFVAGAFIEGKTGDPLSLYRSEVEGIGKHGGTPILFQCSALRAMHARQLLELYASVAETVDELLAFELGEMFASFGQIYSIDVVASLMEIPTLRGIKHSSLNRQLEWQRLDLRDRLRPDFKIYTGNDLAIDMVFYGSDYLLGLSAFCVEGFALRDQLWREKDAGVFAVNDLLQYLGFFAFRAPVPAYKHTAAQFLHLRGLIPTDRTHPRNPRRPSSDTETLSEIAGRLERMFSEVRSAPAENVAVR